MFTMNKLTLTATADHLDCQLSSPIELSKSAQALVTNQFTVGASTYEYVIYGYTQAV